MKYSEHPRHEHGRHMPCREGITAPYCPPPVCEPLCPPIPMERGECCAPPDLPQHKAVHWPRAVAACPPKHYSGVVCAAPPPKPAKPLCENVLLQKIVCCEKRSIPQLCTRIVPDDLPACACAPYTLLSLTQSGAQPWWSPVESHGPDARSHIRVFIPVCCQLCDGEGKTLHTTAVVEAEVSYRPACPPHEHWRNNLFIVPCLRLTGGDRCSDDGSFCVQLEIHLEIYVLRPEPCAMHRHASPEKPIPLYPQPSNCHNAPYGIW